MMVIFRKEKKILIKMYKEKYFLCVYFRLFFSPHFNRVTRESRTKKMRKELKLKLNLIAEFLWKLKVSNFKMSNIESFENLAFQDSTPNQVFNIRFWIFLRTILSNNRFSLQNNFLTSALNLTAKNINKVSGTDKNRVRV